ncbi:MAG: type II toxin-antitoxin system VapB family antitoxin [Kineosporiaceae bacterium]
MKTTIDVPDELARRARQLAQEQGTTLRELVVLGLQAEVERRSVPQQARPFRLHSVGGSGLRSGVEASDLTALAYGDLPR